MRGHAEFFCLLGAASYLLLVGKIESLNLSDNLADHAETAAHSAV
jgi:hypothetical protein